MKLKLPTPIHLTYCTNVHPGERVQEMCKELTRITGRVKEAVSPENPLGVGLRISARAAEELERPTTFEELRNILEEQGLYVFTINGFPYGQFHQTRVKEAVYAPDWTSPKRLIYTRHLANSLARLLPEGEAGSISTVPVSWKAWMTDDRSLLLAIENLAELAVSLSHLENNTGKYIHLGLEPEPTCYLETTKETIDFFNQHLFPTGVGVIRGKYGTDPEHAEQILRRHIGVCVDTCHVAMAFEDPATTLVELKNEDILISKLQLSAALEAEPTPAAFDELDAFAEHTYLHQVVGISHEGEKFTWNDLPEALLSMRADTQNISRFRVHYHVPLFWPGTTHLQTTRNTLYPAFWHRVRSGLVEHVEIETYTFDVWPDGLSSEKLPQAISKEFIWSLQHLIDEQVANPSN